MPCSPEWAGWHWQGLALAAPSSKSSEEPKGTFKGTGTGVGSGGNRKNGLGWAWQARALLRPGWEKPVLPQCQPSIPAWPWRPVAKTIFRELGVCLKDLRPGFIFNFFPVAEHDCSELRKGSGSQTQLWKPRMVNGKMTRGAEGSPKLELAGFIYSTASVSGREKGEKTALASTH